MYQKLLIAIDPEDDGEAKFALATAISMLPKGGELHLASIYSLGDSGFSVRYLHHPGAEEGRG
tara:strand:+ start:11033 stop:11221 length:189 start_codon:yes stop_codon:yes gene_type:complete